LKLPQLTTDIDCEPLGYPKLLVTFWLNTDVDEEPPEPAKDAPKPPIWEMPYYRTLGRILLRVTVPKEFSDSGAKEVLEVGNGKALYDLEHMAGFDPQIIQWSLEEYRKQRQERLRAELKN
jgi:hypothetical protein